MAQIIVGDRIAKTLAHDMHILETPRLILREFVVDDVDALALVLSDPEAMRFYPAPSGCAGVAQWIAHNLRRHATNSHGLWQWS